MDVKAVWQAAQSAAGFLAGGGDVHISLGCNWSETDLTALAEVSGGKVKRTLHLTGKPEVFASVSVGLGGVEIHAQGNRPATAADSGLEAYLLTGECSRATEADVGAALGVAP